MTTDSGSWPLFAASTSAEFNGFDGLIPLHVFHRTSDRKSVTLNGEGTVRTGIGKLVFVPDFECITIVVGHSDLRGVNRSLLPSTWYVPVVVTDKLEPSTTVSKVPSARKVRRMVACMPSSSRVPSQVPTRSLLAASRQGGNKNDGNKHLHVISP